VAVASAIVALGGRAIESDGMPALNLHKPTVTTVYHRQANGHVTASRSTAYPLTDGNPFEIFGGFVMFIIGAPTAVACGASAILMGKPQRRRPLDCEGRSRSLTN